MEKNQALELLGLSAENLSDNTLRSAYWAKAKEQHTNGADLTELNVAKDLLEEEISRRRLPAVIDANAALVSLVKSQSKTIQEQVASEKLSAGVRAALVKLTRQDRRMRETAALAAALSGAMAFVISNVNLQELLGESVTTSVIQLGLWMVASTSGLMAFMAHRRVEQVESQRDDVLRQIRRVSTRQQILARVFRLEAELSGGEFRHYVREQLAALFEESGNPDGSILAERLSSDFEDYLVDAGELFVATDEWGDAKVRRSTESDVKE